MINATAALRSHPGGLANRGYCSWLSESNVGRRSIIVDLKNPAMGSHGSVRYRYRLFALANMDDVPL